MFNLNASSRAQAEDVPSVLAEKKSAKEETPSAETAHDPIERLRKRYAWHRWKELSKGWKQSPKSKTTKAQPVARHRLPLNKTGNVLGPRLEAVESASSSPVPPVIDITEKSKAVRKPKQLDKVPVPRDQNSDQQKWKTAENSNDQSRPAEKQGSSEPLFRTASLNQVQVQGEFKNATPTEIKKITEISPFSDYEPDPNTLAEDPCRNQCPRPDGLCAEVDEKDRFSICPELTPLSEDEYQTRHLPSSVYAWEAPNLWHNPLYFEDPQLERYGHSYNEAIQPFVSIGKFGIQLVGLPYQMKIDPVCKKKYTLGWYRPGECAPKKLYQVPFNCDAAATQAAATTGMIFLIP